MPSTTTIVIEAQKQYHRDRENVLDQLTLGKITDQQADAELKRLFREFSQICLDFKVGPR